MYQLNTANSRLVFDNAKNLLLQNGYNPETAKLTQSSIRSEVLMATAAKFHIPISVNDQQNGTAFITERRLQLTDVFIVSEIAIFAAAPASATAAAGQLYTYGNTTIFTGSNVATSINAALCNGYISALIDNDQVVPYWPTYKCLRVPATQQASNAGYTSSGVNPLDSFNGQTDGAAPVEGNLVLSGNSNFDFSFNTGSAMTAVLSNSRWVFQFYGVLAQNVSKIAN